jgi:hypothetical protein
MRRESDTLRPRDRAPEFTLPDAYGRLHTLRDLLRGAGTRVPSSEQQPRTEASAHEEQATAPAREKQGPTDDEQGPRSLLLVFDRGTW